MSPQLAPNFAFGILAQFQLIYMHYNSISQHNAANFPQICMPHIDLLIVSATCCVPPRGAQLMQLATYISCISHLEWAKTCKLTNLGLQLLLLGTSWAWRPPLKLQSVQVKHRFRNAECNFMCCPICRHGSLRNIDLVQFLKDKKSN